MDNLIVADSATSASGKDVYASIRFGISIIHPDGRHVPPMSVSAAAQQEPAVFLTFAEEVSHEAERLKAVRKNRPILRPGILPFWANCSTVSLENLR